MIAGAEAHRIGKALASVEAWAAEIIVVLNEEVQDGTERIAAQYGAKVFREPWKGHVAQKNSAAAKASQPWLLGLDADEAVSPELAAELPQAIAVAGVAVAAYRFPRCTLYCGRWIRHGDWYPDYQTRLWRRGQAEWTGIDPHDRLNVPGRVERLRGPLQHFSMESLNHQVAKTVQYADEFVRQCAERRQAASAADLAVRPFWRFFRGYVVRLSFLDGWQGFSVAWMTAFYTFLRYVRVREEQERKEDCPASAPSPSATRGERAGEGGSIAKPVPTIRPVPITPGRTEP